MTQFPLRPLMALLASLLATNAIASNYAVTYGYNEAGQVSTVDGPRDDVEDVTRYDYDANGNLSRITNALGHYREFLDYNAQGKPERLVDENGVETLLGYTAQGQLASIRQGAAETSFSYDAIGQLIGVSLPTGLSLTYSYDDARRLTTVTRSSGEQLRYDYDAMGNVTGQQLQDSDGNSLSTHTYRYDELGRLLAVVGNSFEISYSYTANSQRQGQVDGRGNPSSQQHDALGRVVSQVNEMAQTVGFGYDSGDNLTRVTDARGNSTHYQRDHLGRVTQLTSPDTGVTQYDYDSAGNLSYRRDGRGVAATYLYDPLNRLTDVQFVGAPEENLGFRYDSGPYGLGRLTHLSSAAAQLDQGYNAQGQLSEVQARYLVEGQAYSLFQRYHYNDAGQLQREQYPNGLMVTYGYNGQGEITAVSVEGPPLKGAGATVLASDIRYRPFGGLAGYRLGNGTGVSYHYDNDGRLSELVQGDIRRYRYHYDGNSNITAIDRWHGVTAAPLGYSYDPANRLTQENGAEGEKHYQYDANGNRTRRVWVQESGTSTSNYGIASDSNRLLTFEGKPQAHDGAGNTIATNNGTRRFEYSATGRYVTLIDNGVVKARYSYDGHGQRIAKQLYTNSGVANGRVLFSYNQRGQLIHEQEYRPDGTLRETRSHIWLGMLPVATLFQVYRAADGNPYNAEFYYVLPDHLTTPRALLNASQQEVWRWQSDAFGHGQDNLNPDGDGRSLNYALRFPGQYHDRESGHYYNYFRDYAPSKGQYIQSDPIGLAGGMNTYGYVGGNPVGFVDPLGLYTEIIIWQPTGRWTSSFGHVSSNVNGRNYSWAPGGWDTKSPSASAYANRQITFRSGVGQILNLTPAQEQALVECYERHGNSKYSVTDNNCGDPHKNCLKEVLGISVSDSFFPVNIGNDLLDSPYNNGSVFYTGPERGYWADGFWAR